MGPEAGIFNEMKAGLCVVRLMFGEHKFHYWNCLFFVKVTERKRTASKTATGKRESMKRIKVVMLVAVIGL